MNNKEIKFDILENADLEKIEQIGPDKNMIDDDAKNRMFAYAQKQYSKMSGKDIPENKTDSKEYICGVENMDKRKKSRIIMTVCSVAASFALIFGMTAFLKGNNSKPPVKPDSVNTDVTNAVTTGLTEKTSTVRTKAGTTVTTVTTEDESAQFNNYDTHILERETEKVLKEFIAEDDEPFFNIQYVQPDLNDDAVPELIITGNLTNGDPSTFFYFFNGSEYVKSDEKLNTVMYSTDSNYLVTYGKYMRHAIFEVSADNQLILIDEPDDVITSDGYDKAVNEFCLKYEISGSEHSKYNWQNYYNFYAEHNDAYVDKPYLLKADIDLQSLAEQGIISNHSDSEYSLCIQYIDENMEDFGGYVASENIYSSDYSEKISEDVSRDNTRKKRLGIELYDKQYDVYYSGLCIADLDLKTGECNIVSDKTNGAARFRFEDPE